MNDGDNDEKSKSKGSRNRSFIEWKNPESYRTLKS